MTTSVSKDVKRESMNTIIMTYPGFHALPRGIKMMLVESENFFFGEIRSRTEMAPRGTLTVNISLMPKCGSDLTGRFMSWHDAWRN